MSATDHSGLTDTGYEVVEYVEAEPQSSVTLFRTDDPVQVVQRATDTANALMAAVRAHDAKQTDKAKKLISVISGREFPKVECWMLLGTMLGVFPVLDGEVERVDVEGAVGWKATVNAQTMGGAIVGRASALCLRSESNWKSRDDYALASMAQTRATSKALSVPLRFVMALAGLEGTPAEEMPGNAPEAAGRAAVPSPAPEVRTDGKRALEPATTFKAWAVQMESMGVTDPNSWLKRAVAAYFAAESLADLSTEAQREALSMANAAMFALGDGTSMEQTLGVRDEAAVAVAFGAGFGGVSLEP